MPRHFSYPDPGTPDLPVGEAADGSAAIELAAQLKPDLVLMDVAMHGVNGVEATWAILTADPDIRVFIVTMFEDDAAVFTRDAGRRPRYILEDAEKADVLRAIRAVGNGEAIFSPAIAARLIEYFGASKPAVRGFPELTSASWLTSGTSCDPGSLTCVARR